MSSQFIDDHSGANNPDVFLSAPPPKANVSVHSGDKTTPSQRKTATRTPDSAKNRVQMATKDLSGGNCLIENVEDSIAVQYAHCLARATPGKTIDCLEFSWNMAYRSLNVDTRENIFKLSATLHILFDSGAWMLLPEECIINQYYTAARAKGEPEARRAAFPVTLPGKKYTYKLLGELSMRRVPIHRQKSFTSLQNDQVSERDFTFLDFPYDKRRFISHIHPRFVICNAGQKLIDRGLDYFTALQETYLQDADLIRKVLAIYNAWTKDVEMTKALFDFRRSGDSGGPEDTQSQNSRQGSPMSQRGQGKKQKGENHDAAWLDEGTLCELESEHAGRGSGKGKEIMEWASCVAELSDREHVMESPARVIM
ncbi:hypothetical protein BD779DRAFT_1547665 [Infundibulicybe gibba]|nr:hypothetical protein BD779DRAFT_1547665 [Infundibulicybe gibba]